MNKEIVTTKTTVKKPRKRANKKNKNKKTNQKIVSTQKVTTTSSTLTNHKPSIVSRKDTCRIVHCEPLGVVSVPDNSQFKIVTDLNINPGDPSAFPWLSTTAQAWEYYRIHRLSYHFMSRTSTLTSGEVVMAPDYDINDEVPTTIEELTQNEGAVSSTAFKDFHCELSSRDLMGNDNRKLVRGFIPRSNFDQGRYDVGSFYVAVSGISPNPATYPVTIGRLYVKYDIEFYVPVGNKTPPPLTASILAWTNAPTNTQSLPGAGTVTVARPSTLVLNGLDGILAVDTPGPGSFTALSDTILKVSGLDQYVQTANGAMNVSHQFQQSIQGITNTVGGSTAKTGTVIAGDQADATFDFVTKLNAGDILNHFYQNSGQGTALGGYSTLNLQEVGRRFILS